MNKRSWALYKMREYNRTKYTPSQMKLFGEIVDNCVDNSIPLSEIKDIIKLEHKVNNLHVVEDIKPSNPPPILDIAIPELKIAIRVMGLVHESLLIRRKDEDQRIVLNGNDWSVIDVWQWEREDLWK